MVDQFLPDIQRDAGSNVTISHANSFKRLGLGVDLCVFGSNQSSKKGINCFSLILQIDRPDDLQRIIDCNKYDYIYCHRIDAASIVCGCVINRSSTSLIYNIADLHFLRALRRSHFVNEKTDYYVDLYDAEVAFMHACDVVITHSSYEKKILDALDIKHAVQTPWAVKPGKSEKSWEDKRDICFVGFFEHGPNLDGLEYFVNHLMRDITKSVKGLSLLVAGAPASDRLRSLARPNVQLLGHVENLGELFQSVRLSIAPLRYGAGIKGKVLESLALGTPCIMSEIAAEGLGLPSQIVEHCVSDLGKKYVVNLVDLYENRDLNYLLAAKGTRFIEVQYSDDATDAALSRVLDACVIKKNYGVDYIG